MKANNSRVNKHARNRNVILSIEIMFATMTSAQQNDGKLIKKENGNSIKQQMLESSSGIGYSIKRLNNMPSFYHRIENCCKEAVEHRILSKIIKRYKFSIDIVGFGYIIE